MDVGLGKHGVVLQLTLAKRWGVASCNSSQLKVKGKRFRNCIPMMTSLAFPLRRDFNVDLYPRVTLPDFITSARRELIESALFFA